MTWMMTLVVMITQYKAMKLGRLRILMMAARVMNLVRLSE